MGECVRGIAGRGKEPGLDGTTVSHTLDPAAALRKPDVAQPATKQAALIGMVGGDTERTKPRIDGRCVYADAVVGATQLVAPVRDRRRTHAAELLTPAS